MKVSKLSLGIVLLWIILGCGFAQTHLNTSFLTPVCIKPLQSYRYQTCNKIYFTVNNQEFEIAADFETDLASIPRIAWAIVSPAHSALIPPSIVHDWLYTKTCDFTRFQTDLIFYHMLRNNGVSNFKASVMYYSVRLFGASHYSEEYCEDEFRGLDKIPRGIQTEALYGHGG